MALLVPYNEAMRLGMGFNTFTQQLCVDDAIKITRNRQALSAGMNEVNTPSQTVTYSSRIVERLSDIVQTLNISYSAAIKKGTIEVSGNSSTIDEDKIKSSDLNAIVSVKVQNQMTLMSESSEFGFIDGIEPNSQRFNEVFGDGYISGFIEGGEFTGVVSVRVLNREKSHINQVASKLKKSLGKGTGSVEADRFTLDRFDITGSGAGQARSALQDSETTVSVSWNGGGQVKDQSKTWNIDTMFEAAAAFPANVAASPQRTWAIITKYSSNRSYIKWEQSRKTIFSPLEYDNINSFSAELFDNYFQYKQLVKLVQFVIADTSIWEVRGAKDLKSKPIPLDLRTLVAVRAALRNEMNKIVQAVDVLTRDPGILKRNRDKLKEPKNEFVKNFLITARNEAPQDLASEIADIILLNLVSPDLPPNSDKLNGAAVVSDSISHEPEIFHVPHPKGNDPASSPVSNDRVDGAISPAPRELYFDFDSLIAPEVWMEAMPKRKDSTQSVSGESAANQPLIRGLPPIPPPPSASAERQMLRESQTTLTDVDDPDRKLSIDEKSTLRGGEFVPDLKIKEFRAAKEERDQLKKSNEVMKEALEQQKNTVVELNKQFQQSSDTLTKDLEQQKTTVAALSKKLTEAEVATEAATKKNFDKALEDSKKDRDYILATLSHPSIKDSPAAWTAYMASPGKLVDFRLSPLFGDPDGTSDAQDKPFSIAYALDRQNEMPYATRVFYNDTHITSWAFARSQRGYSPVWAVKGSGWDSNDKSEQISLEEDKVDAVKFTAAKHPSYKRLVITSIGIGTVVRSNYAVAEAPHRNREGEIEGYFYPPTAESMLYGFWGIQSQDEHAFHRLGVIWSAK